MSHLARGIRTRSQSFSSSRWSFHTAVAIVGVVLMGGTAAGTEGINGNANDPARGEIAQARQVCETVVRVRPGEAHFDACVSSLTDSLNDARRDRAVMRARNDCFARGLGPNSPDLNLCLLQAANARSPNAQNAMAGARQDAEAPESYVPTSFDAVFHREQQACVRLGFDPAFGAFSNCVANLQAKLQRLDSPDN